MKILTEAEVREKLAVAVKEAGTAANWADRHRIARVYVTDVLNRGKTVGPKILDALGVEKIAAYRELAQSREG